MNTPSHDINHATNATDSTDDTARIHRELEALWDASRDLMATRPPGNHEQAARATRLAMVFARRAGWWRVLVRVTASDFATPVVYIDAAAIAACRDRDMARFWRDCAADWTARAEQRPTSDAAGALSNWHELGVTA